MAKKQQIILTHGTGMPALSAMTYGELLVRHASDAKEAALYTLHKNQDEQEEAVIFPSKAYVDAAILGVDAAGTSQKIDALQGQVNTLESTVATNHAAATAYTDTQVGLLRDGQVETNRVAIALLNDTENVEGSVKHAVKVAKNDLQGKIDAVSSVANSKVDQSAYGTKIAEIEGDVDALEGLLSGYTEAGSVKLAIDSKVSQVDFDAHVSANTKSIDALQTQIDNLNDTYATDEEVGEIKAELEGKIKAANASIQTGTTDHVNVSVSEGSDGQNIYVIKGVDVASANALDALGGRVSTIEGDDQGKSMREVAAEEVKELQDMLYGSGATEAIDTLKDVIDWIDNDTTGAAKIVSDIENLQKVTSGYTQENAISNAFNAIQTQINNLNDTYATDAEVATVKSDLQKEIKAANSAITTGETNHVKVSVSTGADGNSIYAIEGVDVASANALDALGGRVGANETAIAALNTFKDTTVPTTYATKAELQAEAATRLQEDNKLQADINTRATQSALDAVSGRVTTIEGTFVKTVQYLDSKGELVQLTGNTIDLSALVIDGGTY